MQLFNTSFPSGSVTGGAFKNCNGGDGSFKQCYSLVSITHYLRSCKHCHTWSFSELVWFSSVACVVFNVVTVFSNVAMVFSKHHQALLHVVVSCTGVGFKRYHRLFKCCYGLFQASLRSFKRYYTWSVRALVLVSSVTTVFSSAAVVFSKHH